MQLRLVVYTNYKVSYIPSGEGFLPSNVFHGFCGLCSLPFCWILSSEGQVKSERTLQVTSYSTVTAIGICFQKHRAEPRFSQRTQVREMVSTMVPGPGSETGQVLLLGCKKAPKEIGLWCRASIHGTLPENWMWYRARLRSWEFITSLKNCMFWSQSDPECVVPKWFFRFLKWSNYFSSGWKTS